MLAFVLRADADLDLAQVIDEMLRQIAPGDVTRQDVTALLLAIPVGRRFEAYYLLVERGVPVEEAQAGYYDAETGEPRGDIVVTEPGPRPRPSRLRSAWPWIAAALAIGVGFAVGRATR